MTESKNREVDDGRLQPRKTKLYV